MSHHKVNSHKGFTLIELLVVISIISFLSSIVFASLSNAQALARDNLRKQSLVQLRTALELYWSKNRAYPITPGTWYISTPGGQGGFTDNGGNWIPGLVASGAISKLPQDPTPSSFSAIPACGGGWKPAFLYQSQNGTGYDVLSHCAPEGTMSAGDTFYDSGRPTWAWEVCSGIDCAD